MRRVCSFALRFAAAVVGVEAGRDVGIDVAVGDVGVGGAGVVGVGVGVIAAVIVNVGV